MSETRLHYPTPALGDGRIGLRAWTDADLDCVREAGTDPVIPRGTTVPSPFTPAEGLAFLERQRRRLEDGEGVSQAITDAVTDRAIGLAWLPLRPQPQVAGLGYWVVPSARGAGAATSAARLLSRWALADLGLRRVEAWVELDNLASQRVLRSAGFEQEGRLRQFLTTADGPSDALVFSVVRPAD